MSKSGFTHRLNISAVLTVIGILILFSSAIFITLVAPAYVDPTWTQPTSVYQVQMYEVADPNVYISGTKSENADYQAVFHIRDGHTLLAFKESETLRITAPEDLQKYITKNEDSILTLTSRLLLLQKADLEKSGQERTRLREQWERENPDWQERELVRPDYTIWQLYDPSQSQAFTKVSAEQIFENWIDENYHILDEEVMQPWHKDPGVIYLLNPTPYSVRVFDYGDRKGWRFDPDGEPIATLEELTSDPFGFVSRQQLIEEGEHIFAIEGCWYCHTDQTRTLIQDLVLNGSDSYPAPPSSPNEYIYQNITFPGTKRNGPDLSRVGIKRSYRDWHISHFWSPRTASPGSIMPSFRHFFDFDPVGTSRQRPGVTNRRFEAVYQYLMTKGTRITSPNRAWWTGKDPINVLEIIEGRKQL